MTETLFKAACIQLASGSNVNANLLEGQRLMEHAALEGARLIVLPENFAYMGAQCSDMLAICEQDNDGPIQHFLSQVAQKLGIDALQGYYHGRSAEMPICLNTTSSLGALA